MLLLFSYLYNEYLQSTNNSCQLSKIKILIAMSTFKFFFKCRYVWEKINGAESYFSNLYGVCLFQNKKCQWIWQIYLFLKADMANFYIISNKSKFHQFISLKTKICRTKFHVALFTINIPKDICTLFRNKVIMLDEMT